MVLSLSLILVSRPLKIQCTASYRVLLAFLLLITNSFETVLYEYVAISNNDMTSVNYPSSNPLYLDAGSTARAVLIV